MLWSRVKLWREARVEQTTNTPRRATATRRRSDKATSRSASTSSNSLAQMQCWLSEQQHKADLSLEQGFAEGCHLVELLDVQVDACRVAEVPPIDAAHQPAGTLSSPTLQDAVKGEGYKAKTRKVKVKRTR